MEKAALALANPPPCFSFLSVKLGMLMTTMMMMIDDDDTGVDMVMMIF